jgi:hypothetical protein
MATTTMVSNLSGGPVPHKQWMVTTTRKDQPFSLYIFKRQINFFFLKIYTFQFSK